MLLNVCVFVLRYQEFQSRYRCTRTLTEGSLRRSCPIITTLVPRPYIRYSENKTMLVAIIWFGKRPMSVPPICIIKIVGVPATSLIIWCRSQVRKPPLTQTEILYRSSSKFMFSKFLLDIIISDSLLIYESPRRQTCVFIESGSTPAMFNGDTDQYINLLSYFTALVLHLVIKTNLSARFQLLEV